MSHSHHEHRHVGHGRAFVVGIALNGVFIVVELFYGIRSHSLALVADAWHNVGDVLGLLLAWSAAWLAARRPTPRFTYGMGGASIMAALANAVLLLVVTGGIAWEAVERLGTQRPVESGTMMAVAAVGILMNGVSALLFMKGAHHDLNLRGAFLHLAADAAVSAGVVVSGLLILGTGWHWLDPFTSLIVSVFVVFGAWGLLKESVRLALQGVPGGIDIDEVRGFLLGWNGICGVHDLHVWAMSTTEAALSAHLLYREGHPGDAAVHALAHAIEERFGIGHATLQVETGTGLCALADAHPV